MTDWRTVHGDKAPELLDTVSSTSTVYERRNVQEETVEISEGVTVKGYVYEERTYTREEYEQMNSPAMLAILDSLGVIDKKIGEMPGSDDVSAISDAIERGLNL